MFTTLSLGAYDMQVFSFALISDLCPLESRDYLKCTSCSLYESPIAQWVESSKGDWRVVRSIPARGLGFFSEHSFVYFNVYFSLVALGG